MQQNKRAVLRWSSVPLLYQLVEGLYFIVRAISIENDFVLAFVY